MQEERRSDLIYSYHLRSSLTRSVQRSQSPFPRNCGRTESMTCRIRTERCWRKFSTAMYKTVTQSPCKHSQRCACFEIIDKGLLVHVLTVLESIAVEKNT